MLKTNQKELEQYLWGAAILLRGVIDPGEYKSVIFPLLFFKRISDVYDEEYEKALKESEGDEDYAEGVELHRFIVPGGAHWKDIRQVTKEVGKRIRESMDAVEKANPKQLLGIFGDVNWTNKDRLSDKTLIDLIEHFSTLNLTTQNIPDDQFGNAYEYLIKKFADDSGHTAAEFYTNRTVVRLMALIADPKPGESIYDPTCGSGGMLLNAVLLAKEKGREYRNIKLYGQEINMITSAIARMNMFIHGIQDFEIVRGDTLVNPVFREKDKLMKFDIILANPPYSIKKWNREAWINDPWGRNMFGTPPQGCADYAFFQHIIASLKDDTGRCAILWPHGVLFRDSEKEIRKAMLESDLIEGVIGLGESLFYNSAMEACIVICRKRKTKKLKNKVFLIDAKKEIKIERAQSFLDEDNIKKIFQTYNSLKEENGFSRLVDLDEVRDNSYNLHLNRYIKNGINNKHSEDVLEDWKLSSKKVIGVSKELFKTIGELDDKK